MAPKKSAKAKNGRAKKTADAPKRKPKIAKPSLEVMSDQQRQKLLIHHKNKVVPLIAAMKDAQSELNAAYEKAKAEGVPKKEIKLAIDFETNEGRDGQRKNLEAFKRVARWMGVGDQLELFGKGQGPSRDERLFEDGRIAALNDKACMPPDHLGQKDAQLWINGHAAGRTSLNTKRAENGFKPRETVVDLLPPMREAAETTHVAA